VFLVVFLLVWYW